MKKIIMLYLVSAGAVSASAQVCNQSSIKEMSYFMSVYNTNVGKCVVGPAGPACNAICEAVDSMPKELFVSQAQPPPSQPPVRCPEVPSSPTVVERCNQNELDRVYRSAQEDTIRRLKKDLMIEGRVSARGFAQNPDLCVKEAHRKASRDIRQAQLDCERQLTSGLSTRCDEAGMRIVQNPVKVMPYKHRKI